MMEVDGSIVAPSGTQTSQTVAVHPLVIMNISEHWTRSKAQAKDKACAAPVVGAVLGKQRGRHVELCNSFELMVDMVDNNIVIDKTFFTTREEQYKEVFSELDLLGWYTTGGPPSQSDVHVHRQMCEKNEGPIFVKLDPSTAKSSSGKLPLKVYESVVDMNGGNTVLQLVELEFDLVTEEAERIGVDHVAKITPVTTSAVSSASKPLSALHGAVKMLFTRLNIIVQYLQAVKDGKLEKNDNIFREVNNLCSRLPLLDSKEFNQQFNNQCSDITLMAYLGVLTKTCGTMNQLVSKLNILHDKHPGGTMRRGRGLLM